MARKKKKAKRDPNTPFPPNITPKTITDLPTEIQKKVFLVVLVPVPIPEFHSQEKIV